MSEIRDRIARVIQAGGLSCGWEDCPGSETCDDCAEAFDRAADDLIEVFPILARVNDEMVEAGGRALWEGDNEQFRIRLSCGLYHRDARRVLEAMLGKEQSE